MPARISYQSVLALCRVSNLPTVWMNVLTATVLTVDTLGISPLNPDVIILCLSLSALYCAGMSLNDLYDRQWDAVHQPFRPIPSGRISVRQARTLTALLFAAGMGLLLFTPNIRGFWAGLVLTGLIYLYDRFHKQQRISVLLMAATRLFVFIVCGEAIAGQINAGTWLAGSLQFVYTLLITVVSRYLNTRAEPFQFPLIPQMIAGMSILDGLVLAVWVSPAWLGAGIAAALLTHSAQQYIRGD